MIVRSQRGQQSTSQCGDLGSGVMGVVRLDGRCPDPLGVDEHEWESLASFVRYVKRHLREPRPKTALNVSRRT